MEPVHRKIELQAPSELTSLMANASRIARAKIDLHLPPSAAPAGEDALRRRVEELVDAYIRNTFAGVRQNVTVNGIDGDEVSALVNDRGSKTGGSEDEFEPFDHELAKTVQRLAGTLETLTLQLADLRRTAPTQAARAFEEAFARQDAELAALEDLKEDVEGEQKENGAIDAAEYDIIHGLEFKRWDEVRSSWTRGTEGLVDLKGGLTETVARVERAKAVLAELEDR